MIGNPAVLSETPILAMAWAGGGANTLGYAGLSGDFERGLICPCDILHARGWGSHPEARPVRSSP